MRIDHPKVDFVKSLPEHFPEELYLVGGVTRDILLNQAPKDVDLATACTPEVIAQVMRQLGANVLEGVGDQYGTVHTVYHGHKLEITSFRVKEVYTPGNRNPEVTLGTSLDQDLLRRDFTCNAVAANLRTLELVNTGISRRGLDAIDRKIIETPSYPSISFTDDPLRILRAYRFRAQLGFEFAADIRPAIREHSDKLKTVSAERCRDELVKLCGFSEAAICFRYMQEDDVLKQLIPELEEQLGFDQQNKHHHLDLWEHTLYATKLAALGTGGWRVVLTALLHDVAKTTCNQPGPNGGLTYYGHDKAGSERADEILRRLKFSNVDREAIVKMIARHVAHNRQEWSVRAARTFVKDMGELVDEHINLMIADKLAHAPGYNNPEPIFRLRQLVDQLDTQQIVSAKPILDGHQVMTITGLTPGPELGRIMKKQLEAVVAGDITTEQEARIWLFNEMDIRLGV